MATIDDILNQQDEQTAVPASLQAPVQNGGTTPSAPQQTPAPPVADPAAVTGQPQGNINAPATTPASVQGEAKAPHQLSYAEIIQQMNPYTPPTQEELERERKKEKREKIFSAIGDGISAMANLYFTSQGTPNAYDPSNTMSGKTKERWDKLRKERQESIERYMRMYDRLNNNRRQDEAAARQNERAEQAQKNWLAEFGLKQEDAGRKKKAAEDASALNAEKINTEKARQGYYNAGASARRNGTGSSRKTKYPFLGKEYDSTTEYRQKVMEEARKYGVETTKRVDTKNNYGQITTRTVDRKIEDIAAEVKAKAAEEQVQNEAEAYKRSGKSKVKPPLE